MKLPSALALLACALLFPYTAPAEAPSQPEYLQSFDPSKGFKPAQRDLTEIFLQLAGSLEAYGSPEQYLRHVAKEHGRVESLYRQKFGTPAPSFRPDYLTDDYIDRLSANWRLLAPKIGLESYAKAFGHSMRNAIKGTRGTGTIVVDIFNRHQTNVLREMTGKSNDAAPFESLRLELVRQLELDKNKVDEEKYEVARRDAISFALGIQGRTTKLFRQLDQSVKSETAESIKSVLLSMIMDTGMMAQSELQAGIAESVTTNASTAAR